MPPDTALQVAQQLRDALLRSERAAAVRLVNAYGGIYQRLQNQIDALTAELDVMAAEGELSVWKAGKLERLHGLERQIEDEVTRYAAVVENEVNQGARAAIAAGQKDAKTIAQSALPGLAPLDAQIMTMWQSLNPAAVETMLGFLSEGSPLRTALREKLGAAVADAVAKRLLEGIALGYNPRKTAAIIRRELGQGLTWSLSTARTAQLYAYRGSTLASYRANSGIVRVWTWRSARKANTCMACLAMDGTEHKLDETLNDHHNGACTAVSLTKTYREMGLNVDEPPSALKGKTGLDWFKAQPPEVQRQMMGKAKYDAWQNGQIKFAQLVAEHTDPVYGVMRSEASLKSILGEVV